MSLSLGIVGLPNVGKSTLFNALTRSKQANAQNYAFCTIEPNVGVVEVPDERLRSLSEISNSKKTVPAAIEFVDIAGLVKGASEGEGLGNKFLSYIRTVDAIIQVVRVFKDDGIVHVYDHIDPVKDASIINLELILADWETVSRRLDNIKKRAKGAAVKKFELELYLLDKLNKNFESGRMAGELNFSDEEMLIVRDLHLITMKPLMYVINCDEEQVARKPDINLVNLSAARKVFVCAKTEAELADLSPSESAEYIKELGWECSGLDKIITTGYELLDLITYFTSGEPETRAWTIRKNTKAPDAAGVIHTDFISGFIKADVINWKDFVSVGGWNKAKDLGKTRLVGRDYVINDGDVCFFHVNTQ